MVLIYLQIREESIRAGGNRIKKDVDRERKTRGYKKTSKHIRRMEKKSIRVGSKGPQVLVPQLFILCICVRVFEKPTTY